MASRRARSKDFGVSVDYWVRKARGNMLAVFQESAQRVIEEAQTPIGEGGKMPIDTGFLRASLVIVVNGKYSGEGKTNPGGSFGYNDANVQLTIAGAKLGDYLSVAWSANYAPYMEYRYAFARSAVQNWTSIVRQVTREVKQRTG